jgi:hypothetical protein
MALRYATSTDDSTTWVDLNPSMGSDDKKWTQHVLDGRTYRLRFRWIEKASAWLLDLLDSRGEPLLVGIPVRVGQSLLLPHVGESLPGRGYGQIIARDSSSQGQDPGVSDLGIRVKLTYVPAVVVS